MSNCDEAFTLNGNQWCRKCSSGYGILVGLTLSASGTFNDNGTCKNTGNMIADCV